MIGLSLPLLYLVGDAGASPAGQVWQAALGDAGHALAALQSAGVTSVELRPVNQGTDPDLVLRAARHVWGAGLELTVHGYLPTSPLGETFAGLFPPLAPLAAALGERGCESTVTLHCYPADEAGAEETAERTAQALGSVVTCLEKEHIPLHIALENDRLHGQARPGVTYEGILGIVARVASPRLGACWDFGHAYANVQQGQLQLVPPPTFLTRVIHTHVHDLGPRTHYPLTCHVVPLELYVDLLLRSGYRGCFNLELNPERYPQAPTRDLVYASIERLARELRHSAATGAPAGL